MVPQLVILGLEELEEGCEELKDVDSKSSVGTLSQLDVAPLEHDVDDVLQLDGLGVDHHNEGLDNLNVFLEVSAEHLLHELESEAVFT